MIALNKEEKKIESSKGIEDEFTNILLNISIKAKIQAETAKATTCISTDPFCSEQMYIEQNAIIAAIHLCIFTFSFSNIAAKANVNKGIVKPTIVAITICTLVTP